MLVVAFIALFLPLPGSTVIAVVFVILTAEGHRAISKRRGSRKAGREMTCRMSAPVCSCFHERVFFPRIEAPVLDTDS